MSKLFSITPKQVESLTRYLPTLYADGFEALHWEYSQHDGKLTLPHPCYHPDVERFFLAAATIFSSLDGYNSEECSRLVKDPDQIQQASLQTVAELLWYCCRGERFCDGFWGSMIRQGVIKAALHRLDELTRE